MEKPDQHNGPYWRGARSEEDDQKAEQRGTGKQAEQPWRPDFLHNGRASKTPDHEACQVRLQVMSCGFFMSTGQSEFSETDDEAGDANLRSYVEELGDYALNQMSKGKSAAKLRVRSLQDLCTGLADFRQFRQEGEQRNQQKNPGDYEIRGF